MKNSIKLYRVCVGTTIYGNLAEAVQVAFNDIKHGYTNATKVSAPIVTKKRGGYMVTCIGNNGRVFRRNIDCFTVEDCEKKQKVTRTESKTWLYERSKSETGDGNTFDDSNDLYAYMRRSNTPSYGAEDFYEEGDDFDFDDEDCDEDGIPFDDEDDFDDDDIDCDEDCVNCPLADDCGDATVEIPLMGVDEMCEYIKETYGDRQ